MNAGEKIKALRTDRGYTLEELGKKVGVGKSTVRKWETGLISNMGRDKIAKLSEVFNVSPDYFVNDDIEDVEQALLPEDNPEIMELFMDSVDYLQNRLIRTILFMIRDATDEQLSQYIRIIAALQGREPPAFKEQADDIRAKLFDEKRGRND